MRRDDDDEGVTDRRARVSRRRAAVSTFGPYVVGELLGTGGMATVHSAEEPGRRRRVALKRLLPNLSEDPEILHSFIHEARLAMALHHPNIAETYDAGLIDEQHYIAMELVAGPTLSQIMKQSEVVGAIPMGVVLAIIAQICDGLGHAHELCDASGRLLGLVHRDVSPVNVIVSNTGVAKLIDFGLVKVLSSDARTAAGVIKGKFAYLAPEYMAGQLDHRADLFGLGIIAWELLTGRRLFHAKTDLETIANIAELPIQPPSRWCREVTRDIDDIVLTALQRDPSQRWQSARAMRAAIANAMTALGGPAGPAEVYEWVEWAFSQKPRPEDSHLVRLIDMLEEGTTDARVLSPAQMAELEAVRPDLAERSEGVKDGMTPTPKPQRANAFADTVAVPARDAVPKAASRTLPMGEAVVRPRPAPDPAAPPAKPAVRPTAPARSGRGTMALIAVLVVLAAACIALAALW